jgi:hypothetical protein
VIGVDLLEAHLGLGGTHLDPADAVAIEEIERGVVSYVENATGRLFRAPGALVNYFHGTASQVLELRVPLAPSTPADPADGPTVSIRTGGTDLWFDEVAVTTLTHPRLGIDTLLFLDRGGDWPVGSLNIKVSYRGGYAPGREPPDIRALVTALTCLRFTGRPAATAVAAPNGEDAIPDTMRETLDRWTYLRGVSTTRLVRA